MMKCCTTLIFTLLLAVCNQSWAFSNMMMIRPNLKPRPLQHQRDTEKVLIIDSSSPIICIGTAMLSIFLVMPPSAAYAGDVINGSRLFEDNCAACHVGGQNLVNPERNLSKEAIQKHLGGVDEDEVKKFIKDGLVHRGVFAFGGKLRDVEFSDVSAFVVDQASGEKW